MKLSAQLVSDCRAQFPALERMHGKHPAIYLDGPAGTQVPRAVMDAICDYLSHCNANHGGLFATSQESDRLLDEVHQAVADFLGVSDPGEICFGANMTSLTFALSRALAQTWQAGDEIVVTRLEHDANFSPWVLAARDAGVEVRYVQINPADCTLDLADFREKINDKTRLVAVGCASNASGTVNPVGTICGWAREVGALSFLDAVHFAPHQRIDIPAWGCDFLACSAYKFFGPHVGILWGRRDLLEEHQPYKLRPAPDDLPGRWMTGTQNHECLAGTMAAIDYLADLGKKIQGDADITRSDALDAAFHEIRQYETGLCRLLLEELLAIPGITVHGITDSGRMTERFPTVSFTHEKHTAQQLARGLGEAGIFVWDGNYYALPLTEAIGVEPEGMVRVGLVHYNTEEEVNRFLESLQNLVD
ncbi:MAG: cysteine desulfurase-like protein [Planctomycetaceae bacterium]|nr:cysteine desulfurase-like protein [Planctomycetaceae bacterium]